MEDNQEDVEGDGSWIGGYDDSPGYILRRCLLIMRLEEKREGTEERRKI